MDQSDIKILAGEIGPMMRKLVVSSIAPIAKRIEAMEQKLTSMPPIPEAKAIEEETSNLVFLRLSPMVDALKEDVAEYQEAINKAIQDAVALFPTIEPKEVTPEQIEPVVRQQIEALKNELPQPRDGVGLAGAMIDRNGGLILTLTDGSHKDLGQVVKEYPAPEPIDICPDDLSERIAAAVRLMAETPPKVSDVEDRKIAQAPVAIHMPQVNVPDIVIPEIKAPPVHVTIAEGQKRKTKTTVTESDSKGRIKSFVQEEI